MTNTTEKTIIRGGAERVGTHGAYHKLAEGPGQPYEHLTQLLRTHEPAPQPGTSVAHLAHVSDLHITDIESPARPDFFIDTAADPREEQVIPVPRPQQMTSAHAASAAVSTVNGLGPSTTSGRALDCAVFTGDLVDNAQKNEATRLLGVLNGGSLDPFGSDNAIAGTQTAAWADSQIWQPANPGNVWIDRYGFPYDPELLKQLVQRRDVEGIGVPAYLVRGNHDGLLAGTVAWTQYAKALAVGERKLRGLPSNGLLADAKSSFSSNPDAFMDVDTTHTPADPNRVPLRTEEFPRSIAAPPFVIEARGRVSYAADISERVRLIVLDTVDDAGHPDGAFSADDLTWLQDTLAASHDRLVVLASHHGPNDHHPSTAPGAVSGDDVVNLLLQHQNVVLWLTGHAHVSKAQPHTGPGSRGFWEVTAPAIIDWPCQILSLEIFETKEQQVAMTVTHHDLDSPLGRDGTGSIEDIAGLHRELSANHAAFGEIFPGSGTQGPRNVVLHLPAPQEHP